MSQIEYCEIHGTPLDPDCSMCLYGIGRTTQGFKKITAKIQNFGKNNASYWGCALAGEVGEACNLIKKHERDGKIIQSELQHELADIFIYLELTARYFNIDLEQAIINKIEIVNNRRK